MLIRIPQLLVISVLLPVGLCPAQQVIQIRWPTKYAAAPVSFGELPLPLAATIRMGISSLPEETVVSAGLLQGESLGLAAEDAAKLRRLFSDYYVRVRQSQLFKEAPSALAYCYAERKPAEGLATVYLPSKVSNRSRMIIFLHGYGGSLLAYVHFLAVTFPNHVIVCPAYGVSCAEAPVSYVLEAQQAVAKRLKTSFDKPLLMGLSAGAFGAARIYCEKPEVFQRLVCIAAYPPPDTLKKYNKTMEVRFMCGSQEVYATNGYFQQQMAAIKPKVKSLDWKIIAGAGHFFLLSHEQDTWKALLPWGTP